MICFLALVLCSQLLEDFAEGASCDLEYYRGSEFIGPNSARVHSGFLSDMRNINSYAKQCNVKVYITSSYRSTSVVGGAIVIPARRSNHMIGHAIDMNVRDTTTGIFCNSRCLRRRSRRPAGVKCFINKIRSDSVLRWGGDFSRPDPVHIDDKTNLNNPRLWETLYRSLQANCD